MRSLLARVRREMGSVALAGSARTKQCMHFASSTGCVGWWARAALSVFVVALALPNNMAGDREAVEPGCASSTRSTPPPLPACQNVVELEAGTLALRGWAQAVRQRLLDHNGYECREEGGQFLLAFHSATDAVQFSIALQVRQHLMNGEVACAATSPPRFWFDWL